MTYPKNSNLINDTMQTLLTNTADFMFVKNKDLVYVGSSKAFAVDCAGRSGIEEVLGKTDFDIFDDVALAEKYRRDDRTLLESGEPMIDYRESYPDKDGRKRYCLTSKFLIRSEDGETVGVFGQCRDITDQVELEEAEAKQSRVLRNRNDILEALRSVYHVCMFWDLAQDRYSLVSGTSFPNNIIPSKGVLHEILPMWMEHDLSPEDRERMKIVYDLKTLPNRLKEEGTITMELDTLVAGWLRVSLIPVNYDEAGNVISCLWVSEDIDKEKQRDLENNRALREATKAAETDALTGLLNRGGCEYRVRKAVEERRRGLFCMFDVNDFKNINDKYGHRAGDSVLERIAESMKAAFRKDDLLARFGGDEFFVYAPNIDSVKKAEECLERLVSEIEKEPLDEIGGEYFRVSVGAYLYSGEEDTDFVTIYEKCDKAMYRCKEKTIVSYELETAAEDSRVQGKRKFRNVKEQSAKREKNVEEGLLKALSDTYFASYYLDLESETYSIVKAAPGEDMLALSNRTIEEINEEFISVLVAPEDREKMRAFMDVHSMSERLREENCIECEYKSLLFGKWCRARLIAVKHNNYGALTQVLFVLGVLDSKKATELTELEYNKRSLKAIFDNAPGGLVLYEWNGERMKTLHISKYYEEHYGYHMPNEQSTVGPDYAYVHPEDFPAYREAIHKALDGENRLSYVYRVWNKKNSRYEWVQIDAVAEPQGDGTSLVYAVYTDVSDQKEAEQQAEKRQASLEAALCVSNQICCEYDPETNVLECLTEENFLQLPKVLSNFPECIREFDVLHPEDKERFIETVSTVDGSSTVHCDGRCLKDGKYRWYSCTFTPYFNPEKGRNVTMFTMYDSTFRMASQQQYKNRLRSLLSAKGDELSACMVNVTQNTFKMVSGSDKLLSQIDESASFEDIMLGAAQAIVGEDSQKKYNEKFCRDNLLKSAKEGTMHLEMEYLMKISEMHYEWVTAVMDMMENPLTGDLIGVASCRSCQQEHMTNLLLEKTLQQDYIFAATIFVDTDEFYMYDANTGTYSDVMTNYWDIALTGPKLSCTKGTYRDLQKIFVKEDMLAYMEKHGEFSYAYDSVDGDRTKRLEIKFNFMDEDHRMMMACMRNITDLSLMSKWKYESEHDALTGLYNRKKVLSACREMLDAHPDEKFAMLHIDMKNFHRYNSFFGSEAGDKLLRDGAEILRSCEGDYEYWVYGRIEADVYCALTPFKQEIFEKHMQYMERVLENYRDDFLIEPKFGIYFVEDNRMSVEAMIAKATMAAKNVTTNSPRNTEIYNDDMEAALREEQQIISEMQGAIEREEFQVYLQPKYALRTEIPVGAEALVRWVHPEKGLVSPATFIPVFERNGFIIDLDHYVWEHVCILLRRWIDEGKNPNPVSVNVSRISIFSLKTVSVLKSLVEKYDLKPEMLELELTESAYIENPEEIKSRLKELREYGFKILMDDFGSGYSSLNTLRELPVDELKLDMKFLFSEEQDNRGSMVLSSIVRMSKLLRLPVVAEGVETEEQAEYLRSIGCEYAQGYLFAKPMPVAAYEEKILNAKELRQAMESLSSNHVSQILTEAGSSSKMLGEMFSTPMAIVEYENDSFLFLRVNPLFLDEFGLREDLRRGTQIFKAHMPKEDYDLMMRAYKECVQTRKSVCFNVHWREEDGSKMYMVRTSYEGNVGPTQIIVVAFVSMETVTFLE